jgi:glyoxylase-like metal-dependent hydrolase (beta-lactamase superfamily II)/rhodanese-related sulfurtransferase
MEVIGIRTASLGDTTYIVVLGDHAIVVDPQRDIGRFLDVLDERRLTVTHVLETHMHNDYISGGRDLAKRTGADLVLPAASGAAFAFVAAFHRETFDGPGASTIEPVHTPGHTPAHTSYLIRPGEAPSDAGGVFTGGSLLVGAAGRSDLLGDAYARQLALLQYGSLQRLAALPDDTGVYPTHGEGSFCTASGAGRTTSTIGIEKAENPLFDFTDADSFADDQLSGLVPYPLYYQHMGGINRNRPTAFDERPLPDLDPTALAAHLAAGGSVLDGRSRDDFAAGHIPGSIGIEIGDSFAPWAGWLLDFHAPIALVLNADQDAAAAAVELGRIGLEEVIGVLRGAAEWAEEGRDLAQYRNASSADLAVALAADEQLQVLDVRDPLEWAAGHIEGSVHRYLPDLAAGLPEGITADTPVWVICRTGNRASIAAGILERFGVDLVVVAKGGVPDLETGGQ